LAKKIEGKVIEVSDSGNLITDIAVDQFGDADRGDSFKVKFDGHETVGLYEIEHGQPAATMVASVNKAGVIEIEIVGISLSEMLGIGVGAPVGVEFKR
jgi:S-adenosylmethionine hydrolase